MRIADVLLEPDDGDDEGHSLADVLLGSSPAASFSTPSRSLILRWFRRRRKRTPEASVKKGVSGGGVDSGGELSEIILASGGKPDEMAFNLGFGVGMAFLLAKNRDEMTKMKAMMKQMKVILKEIKDEVQRRDDSSVYTALDIGEDAISTTISAQQHSSSSNMEEPKHLSETRRKMGRSAKNSRDIDQLEAELQVEFERMQRLFEGEDDGRQKMEASNSSLQGEGIELCSQASEDGHGVCAYDLEKRLHGIIQARQQERIAALESALESAQNSLTRKEAELCWWMNAAGLIPESQEACSSLSIK